MFYHITIFVSRDDKALQFFPFREKPSMALVLWEPPSKHLRMLPTRDTPTPIPIATDNNNNSSENNNNSDDNNNADTNNLNQTIPGSSSSFEPMEL